MDSNPNSERSQRHIALIGFGEAGQAFAEGWRHAVPDLRILAYDIKTDADDEAVRKGKWADYARAGVTGCATSADALEGAMAVFSLVTADQAHAAAKRAAQCELADILFFDGNSCSPGTKRRSAEVIVGAGGNYVDCAVMAPVHPKLHRTPLLLSGDRAAEATGLLRDLDMSAEVVSAEVGVASSIKMIRSVMMKGLEALMLECVLAGRAVGVDERVLASLAASYPGFDWPSHAAYMMERATTHGLRRAAEMREVAATLRELGLPADMAEAAVHWQQRAGEIGANGSGAESGYAARADALLSVLSGEGRKREEAYGS